MVLETEEEKQRAIVDELMKEYKTYEIKVNWTPELIEDCMVIGTSRFNMRKLINLHSNPQRLANLRNEAWGAWG